MTKFTNRAARLAALDDHTIRTRIHAYAEMAGELIWEMIDRAALSELDAARLKRLAVETMTAASRRGASVICDDRGAIDFLDDYAGSSDSIRIARLACIESCTLNDESN